MGSLLIMVLAEHNWFKLTKSICPCQGKNPLSRKSMPEKSAQPHILVESISSGMLQKRTLLQAHLLLTKDKACN
jgi:hypothetical protein